jgi:MFS family permease
VLAAAVVAVTAACAFQYGLPFLIPSLLAEGYSLPGAGALAGAPVAGVFCGLIAWGAAADRWGERVVLGVGLAGAAVALLLASQLQSWLRSPAALGAVLVVAGAAGASVHAASGRLILGWVAAHERGLAMGIRQTTQPLGVALAALVLPPVARHGVGTALFVLFAGNLAAAVTVLVLARDPARGPRPQRRVASPYRSPYLWRIHAASTGLVVPQFTISVFAFDYLVRAQAWTAGAAGALLATAAFLGAGTRLGVGWWSDRVGARLAPMRQLALVTAGVMAVLAVTAWASGRLPGGSTWLAALMITVAAAVTASTNGLAFTAVAERAGPWWAGRALGVQNTAQNALAAGVGPGIAVVVGLAAGAAGYALAFALCVGFALGSAALVPVAGESGDSPDELHDPDPV